MFPCWHGRVFKQQDNRLSKDTKMTIKIPVQIPYEINSLKIVEFVVTPLTFSDYVAVVKKALDDDTETASVNVLIRRGRFMKQVQAKSFVLTAFP
jgi:hypothetical protein